MSIADKGIPYVEVKKISDLLSIKQALSQPKDVREEMLGFPVETIVIDTIDEVQNLVIAELLAQEKKDKPALQDWGKIAEEMKAIIRGFRNLDMHVVFTCHLKSVSDEETGRTWYMPGMAGQIAEKIPGMVDLSMVLRSAIVSNVTDKGVEKREVRLLESGANRDYPFLYGS